MFGLGMLTKAIATLTSNLTALAGTVAEINSGLRGRPQLDSVEPDQLPHVVTEPEPVRKGRRQTTAAE